MSDRLRQYGAVQSDVAPVSASAMAVDIRTFPWIRRLASEICGECVPKQYAPELTVWMDRIQDLSRRLSDQ